MYDDLQDLAHLLASVSPYRNTKNNYQRLKYKIIAPDNLNQTELYNLFDDLVHGITKLNQMYRVSDGSRVLSTREDNLIALQIMKKVAFPDISLSNRPLEIYNELRTVFERRTFEIEEAYEVINLYYPMHIGSLHRHFLDLRYANRLEVFKKEKYNRIIYRLNPNY